MKAAIYIRVSTNDQDATNQLPALEKWAQERGWQVVAVYREETSAWKAGQQSELKRLREAARQRQFDVVLVWALDRLTREGAAAILSLVNSFKAYGVKVYSYQESWTEAPGEIGEVLYALVGWVARMESERRSERTKAGIERRRQELGGRLPPRGKDKKKRRRGGYFKQ